MICGCAGNDKHPSSALNRPESTISCKGYSFVENEGISEISAPFEGRIVSLNATEGQPITKGQSIAVIENSDLLLLQQDFLEARNLLDYYSQEYARQGNLTVENATSIKKMQTAQRDYQSADLKYHALRKQLVLLGMNPDGLKPDEIRPAITVRSPSDGIVTSIYVNRGSYVEKGKKLVDLALKQTILLRLEIHERDIMKINKNQKVVFSCAADSLSTLEATIVSMSNAVDPVSHMGTVIAKPLKEHNRIIPGMTVNAVIYTGDSEDKN